MPTMKCPGQDLRYWKPGDIFEEPCPDCGNILEFWKTDIRVRCENCRRLVSNPRFDMGCANWCSYAEECLGDIKMGFGRPDSVLEKIKEALDRILGSDFSKKHEKTFVLVKDLSAKRRAELVVILIAFSLNKMYETFKGKELDTMEELFYQLVLPPRLALEEAKQVLEELEKGPVRSLNARILHKILKIASG